MKLWLSKRMNGTCMLTRHRPIRRTIEGFGYDDFYVEPGDPIGVTDLCPRGVAALFGREPAPLESVRVRLKGELLDR